MRLVSVSSNPPKAKKPYSEKLKDPRWQKRRLELFEAANWTCSNCGSKTETLHAHHGYYKRNTEPWDYPDSVMHVLCEACHEIMQKRLETIHRQIAGLTQRGLENFIAILETLREAVHAGSVQWVLLETLSVAESDCDWPDAPNDELGPDFEWLQRNVLRAAMKRSMLRGLEKRFGSPPLSPQETKTLADALRQSANAGA